LRFKRNGGLEAKKMSRQAALNQIAIGLIDLKGNTVPAALAREQGRIAASDATINNPAKRYFAYSRYVPDRSPDVMTFNSDTVGLVQTFRDGALANPQCVWVGIWDNESHKLISDSLGGASISNPVATKPVVSEKGGGKSGLVLGGIAAAVGIFIATRKKG
jgi:hypothetical protein